MSIRNDSLSLNLSQLSLDGSFRLPEENPSTQRSDSSSSSSWSISSPKKSKPFVPVGPMDRVKAIEALGKILQTQSQRGKFFAKDLPEGGIRNVFITDQRVYVHLNKTFSGDQKIGNTQKSIKLAYSDEKLYAVHSWSTSFSNTRDRTQKMLHNSFRREVDIYRALNGVPHTLQMADFFTAQGKSKIKNYLFMPFCANGDLHKIIHNSKVTLTPEKKREIAICILKGLQGMHDRQILHRDLKPGNIFINENFEPLVADFNFARNLSVHKEDGSTGTLTIMAPELFNVLPQATIESDIYSAGCVLFELYFGKHVDYIQNNFVNTLTRLETMKEDWMQEPTHHTIEHVIWQMVRFDPKDRISLKEAISQLEQHGNTR